VWIGHGGGTVAGRVAGIAIGAALAAAAFWFGRGGPAQPGKSVARRGLDEYSDGFQGDPGIVNQHLRFLEALVNAIPNPVFYLDKDGRYRLCNDALADQVLGLPLEEIAGKTVRDFPEAIPPHLAEQYAQRDRELMEQGGTQIYEAPVLCRGGVQREFLVCKALFRGEGGRAEGIIGVLSDITERRQVQQALEHSQKELEKAMDLARLANWQHDPASGVFTFNDRFYALHATTVQREGGYHMMADAYVRDFLFPEDSMGVSRGIEQAKKSPQTRYVAQFEHRIRRRDGCARWVLVRAEVTKDARGEIGEVHGTLQDVTEAKEAQEELRLTQEALRQGEALLRAMTNAAPLSFYAVDSRRDEILYFNQRFIDIWKLQEQQERLRKGTARPWEFFPHCQAQAADPAAFRSAFSAVHDPENSEVMEAEVRLRDGRTLRHHSVPVRDAANEYVCRLSLLEDITARKHADQQIEASLKEKEVLLREVYHRVKNNLQVISSLLNLQSDAIRDPETLRLIRDTQDRVRSMALVHEKLYRAKDLSRIDFAEYAQQLVTMLARSYRTASKPVNVRFDLAKVRLNLDTSVPCGLILNELVSNALKYAFPNAGLVEAEVSVTLGAEQEGFYLLTIADNGVGVPSEIDICNTPTLGLQVVTMLSEQLGGSVELERGNGAKFRVRFREIGERLPPAPALGAALPGGTDGRKGGAQ
jgi:PAS domain S-box-containing protein